LGQMYSAGPYALFGDSTFSSSALTALVQSWIDGTLANNGLILKLSGPNPNSPGAPYIIGDSFSSREEGTYAHAPQLVITQVPEPATLILLAGGFLFLGKRQRV